MEEDIIIDEEEVVGQIPVANKNIENQGGNIPLTDAIIENMNVLEL